MPPTRGAPVVVVQYDPEWARVFEALRDVYRGVLGGLVIAVEHVGSTAVPGLLAKPIIDIDLVVRSRDDLPVLTGRLALLGYRHAGDLGVTGREAFARDEDEDVPRGGSGRRWPAHHLYACATDAGELRRHLSFRDWLRSKPAAASEYGKLKERLAQLYREDGEAYTEAKTDFIEAILKESS